MLEGSEVVLTGTPQDGDEGEHAVELLATDGAGVAITQSFTITVELDPAPFRVDELSFVTEEDTLLEGLLSAEHVEGAALVFGVESEPASGTLTAFDEVSGAFTYAPLADFAGEDGFVIHISDERAREITAPVTITVNAVNDAPRLEVAETYTVTVGEEVALPVVATDVEGDAITVTVEALPPDLVYQDGAISGVVAEIAVEGSPFVTLVTASDSGDAVTQQAITWVVNAAQAEDEISSEGSEAGADQGTEGDATETEASLPEVITLTASAARTTPGSDALAAFAWLPPVDFGDCPVVSDALALAPLDAAASLFDEATAAEPTGAPALSFDVELAAGDYALLVCGCAPTYSDAERVSLPATNQALFAGVDGVTILTDEGAPALLSGFAAFPGFTWQTPLASPDGAAARLTVAETGTRSVDLWMADDGVLVQAVSIVPAAQFDAGLALLGQACANAQ